MGGKRKRSDQGINKRLFVEYAPKVVLVTPKQYKRIENIRAAFRPEAKPKVTLPKFSWDKKDDE